MVRKQGDCNFQVQFLSSASGILVLPYQQHLLIEIADAFQGKDCKWIMGC